MFVCPCMAVFQPLDGLTGIFTGFHVYYRYTINHSGCLSVLAWFFFQPLDGLTSIFTGSQVRIFERDWPNSIYNFMFSLPGLTCKHLADTKTLGFHFSSALTTDYQLVDIRLNTHISITCDIHFHFHLFPFP